MRKRFSTAMMGILVILSVMLSASAVYAAVREKVLYSFNPGNGTDGNGPFAGLIFDAAGNLYGTTCYGGTYNSGAVFELTPNGSGGWNEAVLYSFNPNNGTDGTCPMAGLVLDASGNLYGTTFQGGAYNYGTVFELTPNGSGGWSEEVLYGFNPGNGTDGAYTQGALIFDAAGNLYGTNPDLGTYYGGTVFELIPQPGGVWSEVVLYNFNPRDGKDGNWPNGDLIFDAAGNLYGTTYLGGVYGYGTAFGLRRKPGGGWEEGVLHSFDPANGKDGSYPTAGLILDAAGNLYGTTYEGGVYGYGTVFGLGRKPSGGWEEGVLHSFNSDGADGISPLSTLIFDAVGNLYGTTQYGGVYGYGTAFRLRRKPGGGWTEGVYSFDGEDGVRPCLVALISDAAGNLYGTTTGGGTYGYGTVFEITP